MKKLGIAGFGFVGQAVYGSIKCKKDIIIYDKYKKHDSYRKLLLCDYVFVCLPTPSINSKQDTTELDELFSNLKGFRGTLIVKSTVVPSFYDKWKDEFKIVYNPEFLKQNDAIKDFQKQRAIVIGGECDIAQDVEEMYKEMFELPRLEEIRIVSLKEAVNLKYVHNIYHAYKALFWNYVHDVTGNHRKMFDLYFLVSDYRNEMSNICADGKKGFGGACFPKDLIAYNKEKTHMLTEFMIDLNTLYRPEEMENKL